MDLASIIQVALHVDARSSNNYLIKSVHVKDLRVLCADRSLKDMVLIDNAAYSFGYQIDNGIPIIPYYDNKNDTVYESKI